MAELVVYFSRAGENYFEGSIRNITKGNTEIVAERIVAMTGDDIFKVESIESYSDKYSECIEQAKKDLNNNHRPELVSYLDDINKYDSIILCFPNYWSHVPVAISTFLERYDFSGKTIKPLCTHEGSNMGSTEEDIRKSCPKAILKKGLAIKGGKASDSDDEIKTWLGI